ncbi:MAG TPA: type II toxin-antitoxin system VapC family toxin [Gemmatimonadota bacterium]|nr:type II toxin-antitoxin system VapC family toxin [Gemmatimonadota bacterium]
MILDTSAILAILFEEEYEERLTSAIGSADLVGAGTPTLVETGIVLEHRLPGRGRTLLERFLTEAAVEEVPFGDVHWRVAVEVHGRYGKGRHPAGLNLGDCFAYATARVADEPLLFVGDDFARTDIRSAV